MGRCLPSLEERPRLLPRSVNAVDGFVRGLLIDLPLHGWVVAMRRRASPFVVGGHTSSPRLELDDDDDDAVLNRIIIIINHASLQPGSQTEREGDWKKLSERRALHMMIIYLDRQAARCCISSRRRRRCGGRCCLLLVVSESCRAHIFNSTFVRSVDCLCFFFLFLW
jgi:hypothetical protein